HDNESAGVVRFLNKIAVIVNCAVGGGILDECAKNSVVEFETRVIVDLDLDTERLRTRLNDSNGLRMAVVGDNKRFSIWNASVTERHRFGGGCGFIEQRRVGDVERGQVRNHCLEIEQCFQSALRDFGL